jgi:isopenicillin N synthase-like dioxygenase
VSQSVPLIDMADWSHPDRRRDFISTLGDALEQFGFIRVRGHMVSSELVERAYERLSVFFDQPMDEKRKLYLEGLQGQRGYTPFRMEHAKDETLPDLKEFWHVGREFETGHPLADVYAANVWPELDGFREVLLEVYDALETCAHKLLDALDKYLGNPEGTLRGMALDGNTILRALHYPAIDDHTFIPGAIRAAAHEDINLITLLITSTASGLQLQRRDGSWMDVNAEPGEIIVDSGDMLARITNGILSATTHRVVNPPDGASRRFSLPFFVHPRPEVILRVFERCQGPGFPQPKPDISADEFLKKRLTAIGLGTI